MAVYALFVRETPIRDAAAMEAYSKTARANPPKDTGMRPMAAYGQITPLEGTPADGVVIMEFPDMEQAKRWYFSDGYQAAIPHRQKGADYRVMFVQGV
jgi:uncharacterized protein (DUF1330 family)